MYMYLMYTCCALLISMLYVGVKDVKVTLLYPHNEDIVRNGDKVHEADSNVVGTLMMMMMIIGVFQNIEGPSAKN